MEEKETMTRKMKTLFATILGLVLLATALPSAPAFAQGPGEGQSCSKAFEIQGNLVCSRLCGMVWVQRGHACPSGTTIQVTEVSPPTTRRSAPVPVSGGPLEGQSCPQAEYGQRKNSLICSKGCGWVWTVPGRCPSRSAPTTTNWSWKAGAVAVLGSVLEDPIVNKANQLASNINRAVAEGKKLLNYGWGQKTSKWAFDEALTQAVNNPSPEKTAAAVSAAEVFLRAAKWVMLRTPILPFFMVLTPEMDLSLPYGYGSDPVKN